MKLSSSPRVVIVILNWNGYRDTVTCMQSLREIAYPSCEVVIVDNGSTDGSVARLREEFKDVVYLENQENIGYTGGNNVGIRYAMEHGAEYVWILNNDTKVPADALTRLIAAAEKDLKSGLIGPKILQMENPELAYSMVGRLNMWFPWPDRMEGEEGSKVTGEAVRVDFLSGASLLVKREFVEKVGLLDERFFFYWEENDWCERGRKAGFHSLLVPDAKVYHKGGGASGKGWNEFTAYYLVRNWILFMRKHAAAKYWVTFLPFLIVSLSYWILKALLKGETAVVQSYLSAIAWNIKTSAK